MMSLAEYLAWTIGVIAVMMGIAFLCDYIGDRSYENGLKKESDARRAAKDER